MAGTGECRMHARCCVRERHRGSELCWLIVSQTQKMIMQADSGYLSFTTAIRMGLMAERGYMMHGGILRSDRGAITCQNHNKSIYQTGTCRACQLTAK